MSKKEIVLLILSVPVFLFGFNGSLHLLSVPSDLAVCAGYLLLTAITIALVLLAMRYGSMIWSKIKCLLTPLGIVAMLMISSGCNKIITPGHVGLLVKQTGSDRGVQDYPIQTGRVFYNPINEDVLEWPTNVQRVIWSRSTSEGKADNEEIAFQSKEGLHFTADVFAAYQLKRDFVPHFYVQFRTEDMDGFTHGFFRDAVRNAFNSSTAYTAEEINGAKQSDLSSAVQDSVKGKMVPYGIDIIQIGFAAPPRPPDQVKTSIENKIAAIQKSEQIEFEKRAAIAEGEKIKAMAEAYASANETTNKSITPQLIEWEKIKKWDGHNSQVVTSGSAGTLVNIK